MTGSENKLTVRPLDLNETELASACERLSLGHEAWSADGIMETMQRNGYYFGAFLGAEFVGHAGFTAVADEGYITNVAVLPQFRRNGAATELTKALISKAKELKLSFLTLEVRESNSAAIALYEKHGFLRVGLRKRFYSEPTEDAIIMTLNF
ncbi:MAG: ribosomal protein S18-alanine N-acetyltransferase [Clostridia bacterium]|nr:ribosomal protein S18-alanine N-acetyltransferase [Clostridia bacterium]